MTQKTITEVFQFDPDIQTASQEKDFAIVLTSLYPLHNLTRVCDPLLLKEALINNRFDLVIINFNVEFFTEMHLDDFIAYVNEMQWTQTKQCVFVGMTATAYQKEVLERMGCKVEYKRYDRNKLANLLNIKFIKIEGLTVHDIQLIVCEYFNTPYDKVQGKSRKREIITSRQTTQYLSKMFTKLSLKSIGEHFEADHTTVMHSCQTVTDLMDTDIVFKNDITHLTELISEIHQPSYST